MLDINRRTFLGGSLGAAALAATGPFALSQTNSGPPSEQLHFALIGAGDQGKSASRMLLRQPNVRMTALCEINPLNVQMVKQSTPDVRVYTDWNEMLSKEGDLQAVVVALPEHLHAEASIAALNAGLHVFCEKPMAYALDQSRDMMEARDRNERVLQIGQQRRSNPLYYLAEQLVQKKGLIGEIIRVDAFWDRTSDWKRDVPDLEVDFSKWGYPTANHLVNWRLYRRYGHGLMTENGTHQMDAASWLLGERHPQRVCGLGVMRYRDNRETYDACTAEYLFEGDVIVRFSQDFHQGFNYQWSYGELLLGSEGALRVTAEQELVHYDPSRRARKIPIAEIGDEFQTAGITCTQNEMTSAEQDRARGGLRTFSYFNEMRIFVDCIRNHRQPACTGEIGHNSVAYTILGAESQYAIEYREFDQDVFV